MPRVESPAVDACEDIRGGRAADREGKVAARLVPAPIAEELGMPVSVCADEKAVTAIGVLQRAVAWGHESVQAGRGHAWRS